MPHGCWDILRCLVDRAQDWCWSSLWRSVSGNPDARSRLHAWPLPEPRDWTRQVNRPQAEAELKAIRRSVQRRTPLGSVQWQVRTSKKLDLEWLRCSTTCHVCSDDVRRPPQRKLLCYSAESVTLPRHDRRQLSPK